MSRLFREIVCGVSLVMGACEAKATPCDPTLLRMASAPIPYAARRNDQYCEGTYALNVAAGFEVASVTLGAIPYGPGVNRLYLSAPLSPSNSTIAVRARGRSTILGYQLDALLRTPDVFLWPTDQVVGRLGFQRRDFGLFGFRRSGAAFIYIPLSASRTLGPVASATVVIVTIAPEHLRGPIEIRISGDAMSDSGWRVLLPGPVNRGTPVVVPLPASQFARPFTLQLRATSRSIPPRIVRLTMNLSV